MRCQCTKPGDDILVKGPSTARVLSVLGAFGMAVDEGKTATSKTTRIKGAVALDITEGRWAVLVLSSNNRSFHLLVFGVEANKMLPLHLSALHHTHQTKETTTCALAHVSEEAFYRTSLWQRYIRVMKALKLHGVQGWTFIASESLQNSSPKVRYLMEVHYFDAKTP